MTSAFPPALYLPSGSSISLYDEEPWEEIERDPRGILMMWEPPKPRAKYIVGMDTAEGITSWSRGSRKQDDKKIDNGTIEVFEVDGTFEPVWDVKAEAAIDAVSPGTRKERIPDIDLQTGRQKIHYRDVQVAEFAAPCDAVEIARVAKVIGTVYRGNSESNQAELIWEAWPGCGMLATQELLRIGYDNLWRWEYISDVAEETNRLGWRSNSESMKLLWYRSRRHLMQRNVVIRSKWLLSEYADAVIDYAKMRAKADYGFHDDRFMATNLALWAGHGWAYEEAHAEVVSESPGPKDYQRYAPGLGDDSDGFEAWKIEAVADWLE